MTSAIGWRLTASDNAGPQMPDMYVMRNNALPDMYVRNDALRAEDLDHPSLNSDREERRPDLKRLSELLPERGHGHVAEQEAGRERGEAEQRTEDGIGRRALDLD